MSEAEDGATAAARISEGLDQIGESFLAAFEAAADEQTLRYEAARIIGPKGKLTQLLKGMRFVPKASKKALGQASNAVKKDVQAAFEARLRALALAEREREFSEPLFDASLPPRSVPMGTLHPIHETYWSLLDIFSSLGFEIADGPQIDSYENCFTKLGFPEDHPATDMQDTFYVTSVDENERADNAGGASKGRRLLRTHTSTIQVREMSRREPPLALVGGGPVYRRDDDATHSPMFFQIEGFIVDENVSFGDLKGVLNLFLGRVFGSDVETRFRPSYFPFVEPGAEVDVRRPGQSEWMEVLGCGMIHRRVFEGVGYDHRKWSGFAFGLGVDRIAMVRHGIDNIRLLYENDVRFLSQF